MKTLKFVSYVALIVLIIELGLTLSIPFRFPSGSVAWDIVISTDILLAILCALLFLLPHIKIYALQRILLGAALVSLIFVFVGWTPWFFAVVFLVALFGIYVAFTRRSEA